MKQIIKCMIVHNIQFKAKVWLFINVVRIKGFVDLEKRISKDKQDQVLRPEAMGERVDTKVYK